MGRWRWRYGVSDGMEMGWFISGFPSSPARGCTNTWSILALFFLYEEKKKGKGIVGM